MVCFLKQETENTHSLSLSVLGKGVKYWFIQSIVAFSLKNNTLLKKKKREKERKKERKKRKEKKRKEKNKPRRA